MPPYFGGIWGQGRPSFAFKRAGQGWNRRPTSQFNASVPSEAAQPPHSPDVGRSGHLSVAMALMFAGNRAVAVLHSLGRSSRSASPPMCSSPLAATISVAALSSTPASPPPAPAAIARYLLARFACSRSRGGDLHGQPPLCGCVGVRRPATCAAISGWPPETWQDCVGPEAGEAGGGF